MQNRNLIAASLVVLSGATAASAGMSFGGSATLTADNHYAFFTSKKGVVTFVGGNELGSSGAPGTYNWSKAESWTFPAADTIYVAAWSDDAVAQGFLGVLNFLNGDVLRTGDIAWDVFATGIDLDDGSPYPSVGDLAGQVGKADANNAWQKPFVGSTNGVGPWGTVAGIGASQWMWAASSNARFNTINGGFDHDEYLIFRAQVPAPGGAVLAALAGVLGVRRRRR